MKKREAETTDMLEDALSLEAQPSNDVANVGNVDDVEGNARHLFWLVDDMMPIMIARGTVPNRRLMPPLLRFL